MIVARSRRAKGFLELCAIVTDKIWEKRSHPFPRVSAGVRFISGYTLITYEFGFNRPDGRRDVMFSVMGQLAEIWDR